MNKEISCVFDASARADKNRRNAVPFPSHRDGYLNGLEISI